MASYNWQSAELIADGVTVDGLHMGELLRPVIRAVVAKFLNPTAVDVDTIAADMATAAVQDFKFNDLSSYVIDQETTA